VNEKKMRSNEPSTFPSKPNSRKTLQLNEQPARIQRGNDRVLRVVLMLVLFLLIVGVSVLFTQIPLFNGQITRSMGDTVFTYAAQTDGVTALSWSPDSKRIVSGSSDLRSWDALTGENVLKLPAKSAKGTSITAVSWSPDGKFLVTGGSEINIWDAHSGQSDLVYKTQAEKSHPGGTLSVNALAWSSDKATIAVAYTYQEHQAGKKTQVTDHWVDVWKVANGQHLYTYKGHASDVLSIVWSPDGKRVASAGAGGALYAWDALTGKNVVKYAATDRIFSVDWSPDGMYLVSASNTSVKIWSVSAPTKPTGTLINYTSPNALVAWSPDGQYIASADTTTHIWNPENGEEIYNYTALAAPIVALRWSPDSKYLAIGNAVVNSTAGKTAKDSTTGGSSQVKVWFVQ
jgi:WD40 repeat protein